MTNLPMPDFTQYRGVIVKLIRDFPSLQQHYSREDLTQEAYARLIEVYRREGLQHERNIHAWVWQVTNHHLLHLVEKVKARKRESGPIYKNSKLVPDTSEANDPEVAAEKKERLRIILRGLSQIKGKPREAIIYHMYKGLLFTEMAKKFGTTPDAWRMAYDRGMKKLARKVTKKIPLPRRPALRHSKNKKRV